MLEFNRYMKAIFFLLQFIVLSITILPPLGWTQSMEEESVITKPSIRNRCVILLEKRNSHILNKQKLLALETRTEKIIKKIPKEDHENLMRFQRNYSRVQHELSLARLKIENIEEIIVRKGCSGLTL